MKRRGGDTLTGGSRDVNPQNMVSPVITQLVADTPIQVQQPLPIPRLPTKQGKNLVIELLGATFYITAAGLQAGNNTFYMNVSTNQQVPALPQDGIRDSKTLVDCLKYLFLFTNVGLSEFPAETYIDLTDNAGHGLLVATDNIYFNLLTTNTNTTNSCVIRLEYRWKEVDLVEYIGIVQSQQ